MATTNTVGCSNSPRSHRPDRSARLAAPTLLRSQALALVYESVHRGEIDERIGRKVLDDIRGLRIRLLGDRSLQDHAAMAYAGRADGQAQVLRGFRLYCA
jgi:hypothetical protein